MATYATYDPTADTLSKYRKQITDKTGPILNQPTPDHCPCGCGEKSKGKNSVFLMGHDARMKGIILRAYVANSPITFKTNDGLVTYKASQVADHFGWLDPIRTRSVAIKANRKVKAPRKAKSGVQVGDTRKIKVGRWEYDAMVVGIDGDSVLYEYATKNGTKTARLAA